MNIGKYGIWAPRFTHTNYPIYTRVRILGIKDGKYLVQPTHLLFGHLTTVDPKNIYILERKNS